MYKWEYIEGSEGDCWHCGRKTTKIEINYQKHICSGCCCEIMDGLFFKAVAGK